MPDPLAPFRLRATTRMAAGGVAALIVLITAPSIAGYSNRVILAFDAGALAYLLLTWSMILTSSAEHTKRRAADDDPGRAAGFFIMIGASVMVTFGGFTWMGMGRGSGPSQTMLIATIVAATLAWLLTHTAFALRYAHMFYRTEGELTPDCAAGLIFPGNQAPDDLDFVYFAFTVGMTFQVSDVQITSRSIRRTVLWHALLAFTYNTLIVALILNLVFAALHP